MQVFHKTGDTPASLFDRLNELITRDLDVGDVEVVLCEFGTEEDEAEVSVRGDGRVITYGKEAVFAMLQMISELRIKHSDEGCTHI